MNKLFLISLFIFLNYSSYSQLLKEEVIDELATINCKCYSTIDVTTNHAVLDSLIKLCYLDSILYGINEKKITNSHLNSENFIMELWELVSVKLVDCKDLLKLLKEVD